MKYAIKLNNSFYFDGANPTSIYDTAGWVGGKALLVQKPTVWNDREVAERILRHWFNNDGDRDYVPDDKGVTKKFRYCTIGGSAVGQYLRKVDDQTKKAYLEENPGPFPKVVEIEEGFGRPGWLDVA